MRENDLGIHCTKYGVCECVYIRIHNGIDNSNFTRLIVEKYQ